MGHWWDTDPQKVAINYNYAQQSISAKLLISLTLFVALCCGRWLGQRLLIRRSSVRVTQDPPLTSLIGTGPVATYTIARGFFISASGCPCGQRGGLCACTVSAAHAKACITPPSPGNHTAPAAAPPRAQATGLRAARLHAAPHAGGSTAHPPALPPRQHLH